MPSQRWRSFLRQNRGLFLLAFYFPQYLNEQWRINRLIATANHTHIPGRAPALDDRYTPNSAYLVCDDYESAVSLRERALELLAVDERIQPGIETVSHRILLPYELPKGLKTRRRP